jgi:hypothetical protein
MKTLKQLLEAKAEKPQPLIPVEPDSETALVPKTKDEKRFYDKHVVSKKDDVAGNKDNYNAGNINYGNRTPTRHGYNPGEDRAVYEGTTVKTLKQILGEKHLTPNEMKKREEIAKGIEKSSPNMPMGKKMAIATAKAKQVTEEALLESESSAATYDNYHASSLKMLDNISKAIGQHSKHVKTKTEYNSGEPQWHHVDHVKYIHRQLQDMHDNMQQSNDWAKPMQPKKLKEEVEQDDLFGAFAEDIRDQIKTVYESLDEDNKQVMIEMIEAEDYDTVVEVVKEVVNG